MSQSLARIFVHIIYSTKDRFPFLTDTELRKQMHAYLAGAFHELESPAIEVGGTEDHVHILCLLSRNYSVSEVIGKIKANSTSWIKAQGGRSSKFSWQSGYGAFSIDESQVGSVQKYIRNQVEHHRKKTFQEEYLEILRQYKMDFDERYFMEVSASASPLQGLFAFLPNPGFGALRAPSPWARLHRACSA